MPLPPPTRLADFARWPRSRWLVFLAPLPYYAANVAGFLLAPDGYRAHVVREDQWLEQLQALCFAVAALATWSAAREAAKRGFRAVSCGFRCGAVLLFVACMEELSWGQRIFDWSTPERLRRWNVQGETNFHNLSAVHSLQGDAGLAVSLLAASGWLALRARPPRAHAALRLLLPSPTCALYFVTYALFNACVLFQGYFVTAPILRVSYQEVFETSLAAGCLVYGVENLRELRRARGA
jgi:hypothetical protein